MRNVIIIVLIMLSAGLDAETLRIPSYEYMHNRIGHHANDTNNPCSVNKDQLGLNNVRNVDQTNANNLMNRTVSFARLPVGILEKTVVAGGDVRFDTVATGRPSGIPRVGSVFVWFE